MRHSLQQPAFRLRSIRDQMLAAPDSTQEIKHGCLYAERVKELLGGGPSCHSLADACDMLTLHAVGYNSIYQHARRPLHYYFNMAQWNVAV